MKHSHRFGLGLMLTTIVFTAWIARASEIRTSLFGDLARSTVQSLYNRAGDTVSVELKDMDHSAGLKETWEVSLTNGSHTGSAAYEVHIEAKESANPGEEAAQIRVIFVDSN